MSIVLYEILLYDTYKLFRDSFLLLVIPLISSILSVLRCIFMFPILIANSQKLQEPRSLTYLIQLPNDEYLMCHSPSHLILFQVYRKVWEEEGCPMIYLYYFNLTYH